MQKSKALWEVSMNLDKEKIFSALENSSYSTRRDVSKMVRYSEPTSSEDIEFIIYNTDIDQSVVTILVDALIRSAKSAENYTKIELLSDFKEYIFADSKPEYFNETVDRLVQQRIALRLSDVGEIDSVWVLSNEPMFTILFAKSNRGYIWFRYQCTA